MRFLRVKYLRLRAVDRKPDRQRGLIHLLLRLLEVRRLMVSVHLHLRWLMGVVGAITGELSLLKGLPRLPLRRRLIVTSKNRLLLSENWLLLRRLLLEPRSRLLPLVALLLWLESCSLLPLLRLRRLDLLLLE